jgi:Bax protein
MPSSRSETKTPQPSPTGRGRVIEVAAVVVAASLAAGLYLVYHNIGRDNAIQWARTSPPFLGDQAVAKPRGIVPASAADAAVSLEPIDIGAIRQGNAAVPAIYFASVPDDLAQYLGPVDQKHLFIKLMLPLVLKVNAEIGELRERLLRIRARQSEARSTEDVAFVDELGRWYGVEDGSMDALLDRIDAIPPSIAIAQSAEESGWGRSRFARVANAVFGQHAFHDDKPQVPHPVEDVPPIRAFPDIISSISAYMHNLNSHAAYAKFRSMRAKARKADEAPDALALAGTLIKYSERGEDYIASIRGHITANRLQQFDEALLAD